MADPTKNTQGPQTTLQIMEKMRYALGPYGDELYERIRATNPNDTFGDEIHELFSTQKRLIDQRDNPHQEYKARYLGLNDDVGALVTEVDAQPEGPEKTGLMATALLIIASQPSPLGQSTQKEMQKTTPGLTVESVMEGPEAGETLGA